MSAAGLRIYDPETDAELPRRRDGRLPDFLRADEITDLFQAARSYWLNTIGPRWQLARKRDWAMCQTAYYAALRVAELCRLQIEDLDLTGRLLFVRRGKGCLDRTVPIGAKLHAVLVDWVGDRVEGVLFPDPRGGHIEPGHFRQRIKFLAKRAGIVRRVHPHQLRHSAATHLLRGGATIYEVQRFLGHRSLQNTCLYLHLEPGRLREAADLL